MTTRQYLNQLNRCQAYIDSLTAELAKFEELALRIPGSNLSGMPGGRTTAGSAGFTRLAEKIADTEATIKRELEAYVTLECRIRNEIDRIPDVTFRLVLRYRHIEQIPFWQIADRLRYSERQTWRIYHKALQAFEEARKK